jgi:hypothetical protein
LRKRKVLLIISIAEGEGDKRTIARRILARNTGDLPAVEGHKLPGNNPNLHLSCTREAPPPPSARLNRRRRRERPRGGTANASFFSLL